MSALAIAGVTASTNVTWIAIGTVAIGCSFVLAIIAMALRARDQKRRLELIETALRNPSLGPEAARELVQALKPRPRRAAFVLGWLGAFAGVGWLCTQPHDDEQTAAIVVTVSSFALITLPLALRELETRRA